MKRYDAILSQGNAYELQEIYGFEQSEESDNSKECVICMCAAHRPAPPRPARPTPSSPHVRARGARFCAPHVSRSRARFQEESGVSAAERGSGQCQG